MTKKNNLILLLNFFRKHEKQGSKFTYKEASKATSYATNTVRKYVSEKLKGKYIFKANSNKKWYSQGLLNISNDEFLRLMSQSISYHQPTDDEKMYAKLIERSFDSFTLALESYNRPSLSNRVEVFTIMMVNAWELFFKAEILKKEGKASLFYQNNKSISITDSLRICLPHNDPIKANIETIINLRDQSIHLLLPELQPKLSRIFQANVLNYQKRYYEKMGIFPLKGQSIGMLSLVIDGPELEIGIIKESYGELTANEVSKFLKQFEQKACEMNSEQYSIPIEYTLALVKNANDADITLNTGNNGEQAVIITKAKDLSSTHPYTTTKVIQEINTHLNNKTVTTYSFNAICKKHKIKEKNDERHNYTDIHRYSDLFVKWVVKNISEQKNWLKSALDEYKKNKRKRDKKRK